MAEETRRKIGKYDVETTIGKGGMGVVYKARDTLGRSVAIKMILAGFAGQSELLDRFQREAELTANLQHPNIVTVYDWGQQDDSPYIVMEFLTGRSLDRWKPEGSPSLVLLKKLNAIEQVCDGLHYAHERNIVHRDISPANIFVLNDESVKLLDFGVARLAESVENGMTKTGLVIGKLLYMSPEQANGMKLDRRTDIFSVGIVLYQLLSGVLPFAGSDTRAIMVRILTAPPDPLTDYLGNCPQGLDEVLKRTLEKNPRDRYQTAEDLAFDLSLVQKSLRRQIGDEYLESAEAAIERSDWAKAREILVELLKLDRDHPRGLELHREIQQILRRQDRITEATQLKLQASEALARRQFKEAFNLANEAISLDSSNYDLVILRDEVRATLNRLEKARVALERAENSLHAQRLEAAQSAVDEALSLDPVSTQARDLQAKISEALADQFRRSQVQTLMTQAREELAGRRYTSALVVLKKVESLDRSAPDIQALLQQATLGQERERRERELNTLCEEIRKLISGQDLNSAESKLKASLPRFVDEPRLLDLQRQISETRKAESLRLALERANNDLISGRLDEAKVAIERALGVNPANTAARDLQARIEQAMRQQQAQQQVENLMDQAGRDLAEQKYVDALTSLERVQSIDSEAPHLKTLRRQALAGQEQERRTQELRAVVDDVRKLISSKKFDAAESALGNAIDRFSETAQLSELKQTLADERQSDSLRNALDRVETSIRVDQLDEAQTALTQALSIRPTDAHAKELQQKLARAREDARNRELIESLLEQARKGVDENRFVEALMILERVKNIDPAAPGLDALVQRVKKGHEQQKRTARLNELDDDVRRLISSGQLDVAEKAIANARPQFAGEQVLLELTNILKKKKKERERFKEEGQQKSAQAVQESAVLPHDAAPKPALGPSSLNTMLGKLGNDGATDRAAEGATVALLRHSAESKETTASVPQATVTTSDSVDAPMASRQQRSWMIFGGIVFLAFVTSLVAVKLYFRAPTPKTVSVTQVNLTLNTNPIGASVHVEGNGKSQDCTTPGCVLSLDPGTYTVKAQLASYISSTTNVNVQPGMNPVEIALDPAPLTDAPNASKSTLIVRTPGVQDAYVFIDGVKRAIPGNELSIDGALNQAYKIRVEKDGYDPSPEQTVTLTNSTVPVLFRLKVSANVARFAIKDATPGAYLFVDGKPAGKIDAKGNYRGTVVSGPHEIQLSDGGRLKSKAISQQFNAGELPEISSLQLPSPPIAPNPPPPAQTAQSGKLSTAGKTNASGGVAPTIPAEKSSAPTNSPLTSPVSAEDQNWNRVKGSSDYTDFFSFLKMHPDGSHSQEAHERMDPLWWDSVKDTNDERRYQSYIANNPKGKYVSEAQARIQLIQDKQGVQKVLRNYEQAYNNRSMDQLLHVWPSIPAKEKKGIENAFRDASSIKMTLTTSKDPDISGDSAQVTCTEFLQLGNGDRSQVFPTEEVFLLKRRNGWVIDARTLTKKGR